MKRKHPTYFDVVISGQGGQGILFTGNLLAHAAMREGKHVTYMPAYGPEMRGGTANCTVVISDNQIGSPIVNKPRAAVAMNKPSLDRFAAYVCRNGLLIFNSSLVDSSDSHIAHCNMLPIPANDLAREAGDERLGNMVVLGALVTQSNAVSFKSLIDTLPRVIQQAYHNLLPINIRCLQMGAHYIQDISLQNQFITSPSAIAG